MRCRALIATLVLSAFFGPLLAFAASIVPREVPTEESPSYGEVYASLKRPAPAFEIAVYYKGGLSNPYFYTNGFGIDFKYLFNDARYFVGLDGIYYASSLNSFGEGVKSVLIDQGLQQLLTEPRSYYGINAGVIPLAGLLNFFSKTVVPFDIEVSAEVGSFAYVGEPARFTLGLMLEYDMMLSNYFGVGTALGFTEQDSQNFGWIPSFEATLKALTRF